MKRYYQPEIETASAEEIRKTQVSVEFDENGKVIGIDTVVVSVMHSEAFEMGELRKYIRQGVIAPVLEKYGFNIENVAHIHINPTGNFVIGGPHGDTGLTGRKIIVDTYGGVGSHGGGAFSGKDPSKVDRSAAYFCRYIAKNLVAAKLAEKCEIQVAYAIGVAQPLSINVDTYGTGKLADDADLEKVVRKVFDLRPAKIIEALDLKHPGKGWCYADTAAYGHFGRDIFPWEKCDKTAQLQSAAAEFSAE